MSECMQTVFGALELELKLEEFIVKAKSIVASLKAKAWFVSYNILILPFK